MVKSRRRKIFRGRTFFSTTPVPPDSELGQRDDRCEVTRIVTVTQTDAHTSQHWIWVLTERPNPQSLFIPNHDVAPQFTSVYKVRDPDPNLILTPLKKPDPNPAGNWIGVSRHWGGGSVLFPTTQPQAHTESHSESEWQSQPPPTPTTSIIIMELDTVHPSQIFHHNIKHGLTLYLAILITLTGIICL